MHVGKYDRSRHANEGINMLDASAYGEELETAKLLRNAVH